MKPALLRLFRVAQVLFSTSVLIVLAWGAYKAAVYFRTSPRYEVQRLTVAGVKRVPENQVLAKVGFEAGTNVFRMDLDQIRKRVEELDRVRYASVQRILPDQIIIRVVEREAIGLTRIEGEIFQFDIDGKILDADPESGLSFPILDTLRPGDRAGNLRKVETYRKVIDEVGQTALSEVHVSDSGDVTVVSASDPVMVSLGVSDFRNRWNHYLEMKPQIAQQYPQAVRVDLRFKNQVIIKMKDDEPGEQVEWHAKKNTL